MYTAAAKCKIGTVERTTWDVMIQKQRKTGFAFIITVAVTGFWLLKGRCVKQIFGRIIFFQRLFFV